VLYDRQVAAILTEPLADGGANCASCGAPFRCGIDDPAGCWCARLPALRGAPAVGARCLCPGCLERAAERQQVQQAAGIAALEPTADPALAERVRAAWRTKTMPEGALGALQPLAERIALVQRRVPPRLGRCALLVFAGDHGLAGHGVSAYPSAVTAQMVRNFGEGGAAVSVLARANDLDLVVVDAGTLEPQPAGYAPAGARFVDARIAAGTADALHAPAMTETQALAAIAHGASIVRGLDADAVALGEMGIGNTSAAALLTARLAPAPLADCVGRGTGLDDAGLARKRAVLEGCLARHPDAVTPLAALAAFGGFETAMLVGAALAAAAQRHVVVVDGFIVGAALLVAARLEPAVLDACVFAHRSAEPGHAVVLRALDAQPLLDLGLRLGEGSGAALAVPLLRAAVRLLAEMASFEQAGVSGRAG
jgi:nicotinate-nucleotide--dimethylbenzimidazole phosphoribosyltransferase